MVRKGRRGEARKGRTRLDKVWTLDFEGGIYLTYRWKIPGVIPVDAQIAGHELERIYQKSGALTAKEIVNESRPESAPLHGCFEWDDQTAAEKYREGQAQKIVRLIVSVDESRPEAKEVRAFVHVENAYKPIAVVVNSEEQMMELLQSALSELIAFKKKYKTLSSLRPIFDAIDALTA